MTYTTSTRFAIVRAGLIDGLGVEDIALAHGLPVSGVRFVVQEMREAGDLAWLWPAEKKAR